MRGDRLRDRTRHPGRLLGAPDLGGILRPRFRSPGRLCGKHSDGSVPDLCRARLRGDGQRLAPGRVSDPAGGEGRLQADALRKALPEIIRGRRLLRRLPGYGDRGAGLRPCRSDNIPIHSQLRRRPQQNLARHKPDQHDSGCRGDPQSVNTPYTLPGFRNDRFQGVETALQTLPPVFGRRDFGIAQRIPHGIGPIGIRFHRFQCVFK